MITAPQQQILRHIADSKGEKLRTRALHWLVGRYKPTNDAQFGALVVELSNATGAKLDEYTEDELRTFVACCEALADCYDADSDEPWVNDPGEPATEVVELAGRKVAWRWAGKGAFAPYTYDTLWRVVTNGLAVVGESKPIQHCEYCARPIVPVRSTAKFCNPGCKSAAQSVRERTGESGNG